MTVKHALLRRFSSGPRLYAGLRRAGVIALTACALLTGSSGHRAGGIVPFASGLGSAAEQAAAGSFGCDAWEKTADAILPCERDNDPFLIFLALRAACPPCLYPNPVAPFSERRKGRPAAPSPDVRPLHLDVLARSAQLLC